MAETEIGRVVGSTDQTDYLVHVNASGDVAMPPGILDRAFGRFVAIPVGNDRLIGIICRTQLINPAYGDLGPRLSSERELPIFSPDYLPETATIVGVTVVGTAWWSSGAARYDQQTARLTPAIDSPVYLLPDADVIAFHRPNGNLRLAYVPRLLARPAPTTPDLLVGIIDGLANAFPSERARLSVVRQSILWHAAMGESRRG